MKRTMTMAVCMATFACLSAPGRPGIGHLPPAKAPKALRIRPTEAARVTYVKYRDPGGWFTMDVPRGWHVRTGLKSTGKIDLISYAITMFDPKRPERELYFCLNDAVGLKSQEARAWHVKAYGAGSHFARMPVMPNPTTAGFFAAMGPLFGYRQFTVLERLGKGALGGEVVVAECVSAATGRRMQGIYHAVIAPTTQIVQRNPFNPAAGRLDVGVLMEFSILSETAPKEEFLDWQPVLDRSFASIVFSDAFHRQRQAAWAQLLGTTRYVMQTADAVRGMIMDSYRRRNAVYDVLSQKRSDATLGYERVQDTQTGEYYRAENGFTDWYRGSRYRAAPEKAAYLSPVSGYINWK